MRYVTITKSRILQQRHRASCPNALDSEKFPPAEDNVITDNDIFWNNFDFHEGAPFKPREDRHGRRCPIGTGVCCSAARQPLENNRIFGNYLAGVAAVEGILLDKTEARAMEPTRCRATLRRRRGRPQRPRPGHDGNGTGNCWGPNAGVQADAAGRPVLFPACPFHGANTFSQAAQDKLIGYAGQTAVNGWIRAPPQGPPRRQAARGLHEE